MNRPKGYKIQPHIHQKIERTIQFTQEVLFIKKGLVRKVLKSQSGWKYQMKQVT